MPVRTSVPLGTVRSACASVVAVAQKVPPQEVGSEVFATVVPMHSVKRADEVV